MMSSFAVRNLEGTVTGKVSEAGSSNVESQADKSCEVRRKQACHGSSGCDLVIFSSVQDDITSYSISKQS